MNLETIKKITEEAFEKLLNAIKEGKSETLQQFLRTMAAFHQYSLKNLILIHDQFPLASRLAGYQQWKKLGRQVRKGEKGIRIFGPVFPKKEVLL